MGRSMGEAATSMQQLLGLMEQNRQVMAAIAKGHGISGREPAKVERMRREGGSRHRRVGTCEQLA